MRLILDAWLERADPYLRVSEPQTGQVILYIGADQLRNLLRCGELSLRDIEERELGHLDQRLKGAVYV